MKDPLYNPVYNALLSGDVHFAQGTGKVRYFDEEISPFAGFPEDYVDGFTDLQAQLPADRAILYASVEPIEAPAGWRIAAQIIGQQFVFPDTATIAEPSIQPELLGTKHIDEMVQLAALTKPGPFNSRTIEFGHYHGIFENGKLAAMTGQRLHVFDHTELSAVCTHPDHLGKGFAAALLLHQLQLIRKQGKKPFLHVRADNERAIALYERLGFLANRPMNFYFMKKRTD